MTDYNFSTLNDKEFESLCIDLLSAEFGKQFTRFKSGRDGGVDGRFFVSDGSTEIIQCKHYLKSGFDLLLHTLENIEQPKVNKLSPQKYYVVTSVPLSPANKTKIRALFTSYMPNDDYVIGQEHLNILLGKYPDLEKKYFKLWLSSVNVLNTILNNAIMGRSDYFITKINAKSSLYVFSDIVSEASKILKEKSTVIIEGEPGIGKSTLAEMLILIGIKNNYKVYKIENSINEAEGVFSQSDEEKQLFYFDDFLGSNYLTAIENHKDSHIVSFIERLSRSKNKKLILTSRTNIIQRAKLLSDTFNNAKTKQNEYILSVTQLSEMNKAEILYNHIWHSKLSESHIDQLYEDKRYLKIIKHKNFNPRIIEFITDAEKLSDISADQYWADIELKLNNPAEIWANTFDSQSNDYIRMLLLLVVFSSGRIEDSKLIAAYNSASETIAKTETQNTDFNSSIRVANDYFIDRNIDSETKTVSYSLFNPSITDFILKRYYSENNTILNVLYALKSTKSLTFTSKAGRSDSLNKKSIDHVMCKLFTRLNVDEYGLEYSFDFIISLIYYVQNINPYFESNKINLYIEMILKEKPNLANIELDSKLKFGELALTDAQNYITLGFWLKILLKVVNLNFLNEKERFDLLNYTFTMLKEAQIEDSIDELSDFINLVEHLEIEDSSLINSLNEYINNEFLPYYIDYVVSDTIDINAVETYREINYYDGSDEGINIYEESIEGFIQDTINDTLPYLNKLPDIYIDTDAIISAIDIGTIKEKLIKDYGHDYDPDDYYDRHERVTDYNSVEELFERNR